jgi:hypothetical protein
MAAVIIELANGLVDDLRNADLTLGFDVARAYVPIQTIAELERVRVTVMPSALAIRPITRNSDDHDYTIDIGVQRFVNSTLIENLDPYMRLTEEIIDRYRGQRFEFGGVYDNDHSGLCVEIEVEPLYDPKHLDEHRVFTSVAKLTFRVARSR